MFKRVMNKIKWWWNTRVFGFIKIRTKGYVRKKSANSQAGFKFKNIAKPMEMGGVNDITVILTAYKRLEYLVDQIEALRKQSIAPKEIWVWANQSDMELKDVSEMADRVVVANSNYLFWGRFSLASMIRTPYVALFDDDILPEVNWFKNCLNTIDAGFDGILGGSGVILPPTGGYSSKNKAGWNGNHSNDVTHVDLVGHSWFFDKKHLKYMWFEEPYSWDNGEDIHFSYMALKHGGVKTYVPPHPEDDQSLWSCKPAFGKVVGRLEVATYKNTDHKQTRSDIVQNYRYDGWETILHK